MITFKINFDLSSVIVRDNGEAIGSIRRVEGGWQYFYARAEKGVGQVFKDALASQRFLEENPHFLYPPKVKENEFYGIPLDDGLQQYHDETVYDIPPCPFCGSEKALKIIDSRDMFNEDKEYEINGPSFAVNCDASTANKLGGCGATSGFARTPAEAVKKWDTRIDEAVMVRSELTSNLTKLEDAVGSLEKLIYHPTSFKRMRDEEKK